uniref:Clp R domain-containing protein n=2 Tax=Chenopodium quinoa TaxID=63459 RepID=A0A803LXE4_CHEQI
MPTAVITARQCLTEEAAKALDDAVSVAKRRYHAQTTSLHAVSALLSPSFSILRESLTRCRSSAYSPRLQFRALELCVGVSLDRLPSSKNTPDCNDDFAPPISNSLMAAIKRSQANQRRQPEMYHFNQSDENCKRIGEVMVKKKERNPLLVGVCGKDALSRFKDCVWKQKFDGFPVGIHGLKLVCLEKEIKEFVACVSCFEAKIEELDLKMKEVGSMVENCGLTRPGVVVNLGELKIWLIGFAANYETYSNFVAKFPTVEKDWDLHPLPITSSRSSFDGFNSNKSSLMGSFVPFGGFFPTPSDYRPPLTTAQHSFTRCSACNEKYEHELGAISREGSSVSSADQHSAALPSWLQKSDSDLSKVKDVKTASNDNIKLLQKKWDDHCRLVHQSSMFPTQGVSLARLQVPQPQLGFPFMTENMQGGSCNSGDSSLNERACSGSSSGMQIVVQNVSPKEQATTKPDFPKPAIVEIPHCQSTERERIAPLVYPIDKLNLPPNQTTTVSVTTDLGLGTIYASKCDLKKPFLQDRQTHLQHFPGPVSTNQGMINKRDSAQTAQSSFHGLDPNDYKQLLIKLSEAVAWQGEVISKISEIVSCCRSGNGRQRSASIRGNIWLSFLGPDKIGKKRIAEALADAMFGSRERLISVDLSSQDKINKVNSLFLCQGSQVFDINKSRITVVDHIAQELCKRPHSVVFLENVDEADLVVQNSLSRAIQTGKFQDSRGREIGINNVVFITTSTVTKDERSLSPRKEFIKFQEEEILEAKNWQMQLATRSVLADASRSNETTVSLLPSKCSSNHESSAKRKLSHIINDTAENFEASKRAHKTPKSSLDLNLPLEDEEEAAEMDICGRAWLEGFFGQVDGNVIFKPFDFDALADKLLRKVRSKFEDTYRGEKISLEIEHEVMVQILAAAWCSNKEAVDHWIEQVLYTSFAETREKYSLPAESVVRLSSCEGVPVKELTDPMPPTREDIIFELFSDEVIIDFETEKCPTPAPAPAPRVVYEDPEELELRKNMRRKVQEGTPLIELSSLCIHLDDGNPSFDVYGFICLVDDDHHKGGVEHLFFHRDFSDSLNVSRKDKQPATLHRAVLQGPFLLPDRFKLKLKLVDKIRDVVIIDVVNVFDLDGIVYDKEHQLMFSGNGSGMVTLNYTMLKYGLLARVALTVLKNHGRSIRGISVMNDTVSGLNVGGTIFATTVMESDLVVDGQPFVSDFALEFIPTSMLGRKEIAGQNWRILVVVDWKNPNISNDMERCFRNFQMIPRSLVDFDPVPPGLFQKDVFFDPNKCSTDYPPEQSEQHSGCGNNTTDHSMQGCFLELATKKDSSEGSTSSTKRQMTVYYLLETNSDHTGKSTIEEPHRKRSKLLHDDLLSDVSNQSIRPLFKLLKYNRTLVEVFSIYIGSFGRSGDALQLYGKISSYDYFNVYDIFNRDKMNPVKLHPHTNVVPVEQPHCYEAFRVHFGMFFDLKDVEGHEISRGYLEWNYHSIYGMKDRRICSIVRGRHGFAAVHYTIFEHGVSANLKVTLLSEKSSDVCRVHGKIWGSYSTYEYEKAYEKEYYRSMIFEKGRAEYVEVEPMKEQFVEADGGGGVPLSKRKVAVPVDASFIVEVNLNVEGEYGEALRGIATFNYVKPKLNKICSEVVKIEGWNYSLLVCVGWH